MFLFSGKIAPNNDNFMYYYCFPMKTLKYRFYFFGVFNPYIMDFWNILQKLKKCKNLTKSALGGVPCLKNGRAVTLQNLDISVSAFSWECDRVLSSA